MSKLVYVIGIFVLVTFLYAIPILTACSFIYKWNGFFQLDLIVASIIEFCELSTLITDKVNRRE